jgi:Spy/CpxP family protein refolding chaperone
MVLSRRGPERPLLEDTVRNIIIIGAGVCLLIASLTARPGAAQQPVPVSAALTSIDEVLAAVRADLQAKRTDILEKNMTLTAEQAAKFWPMFASYQKEQNVIMDEQLRGIQRYIENIDTLDDAAALGLISAHITRDERMAQLRKKWLGDFQKVLGGKLAARAMQIDRRVSLAHQVQLTAKIPVIY